MVWRTGLDAQHVYVNAAWLAFTGRTLEQELGNGWAEGIHPDDARAYFAVYRDHFERRRPFETEFRLRRADGEYRYLLARGTPYTDPSGELAGFVGTCVDIDDHRRGSSAAEDFFEMSLDNVCVVGFDGYLRRVNPSWTRTLGWTVDELRSRPVEDLVHPDDRAGVLSGRQRLKEGESLNALTNRYRCKDGSYRWFEWRSVAHTDRGLIYAVARDITEQKQAEEFLREARELQAKMERQLIFADRMASVGTLAAGVAHEINNPLAYVVANLTLMVEELEDPNSNPSDQRAMLGELATEAQEGAERIRKIVRGLQTFTRAEHEDRTTTDIVALLDMSIDMTFNEFRHRARLVKDYGPVPSVHADEARLGQVFVNLLVNAAQALPEGAHAANEIRIVTSTDREGRAVIEIRDTGTGIPAPVVNHIFDPFFTTKPVGVGTGLGLSICHNTVTSLGGQITVASEEGRGTTFRVVLPPITAAHDDASPATASAPELACASVLVVDDEPAIGHAMRRLLREHDVTAVTEAKQALALLEDGSRFHIIFSDLRMPDMSGMEFHAQLTGRFPAAAARVVFVSGGAVTSDAAAFLDRVPNQVLEKPFSPEAIRDLVQQFARLSLRADAE